eukprot:jgi/Undpi1/12356/HiC_scaffold_5.g02028.m1
MNTADKSLAKRSSSSVRRVASASSPAPASAAAAAAKNSSGTDTTTPPAKSAPRSSSAKPASSPASAPRSSPPKPASSPASFSTPTKDTAGRVPSLLSSTSSPSTSSSGGWSTPNQGPVRTELHPPVVCNRCINQLQRVLVPNANCDFAACSDRSCAGAGILLNYAKPCGFCYRKLPLDTVSLSYEKSPRNHVNGHHHNCLRDTTPGTNESAVAGKATENDIGKPCIDCLLEDSAIKKGDLVILNCPRNIHFGCAKNARKQFLALVKAEQDRKFQLYGAKEKLEADKLASKRKAVTIADLCNSDSE